MLACNWQSGGSGAGKSTGGIGATNGTPLSDSGGGAGMK